MPSLKTETESIEGVISALYFQKDGFIIAGLEDGRSIKGRMASPLIGVEYTFRGGWRKDTQGRTAFLFSQYEKHEPKSLEGIRIYLEKNATWVGKEISKRVVEAYGEEALHILKDNPERVANDIRGITPHRAQEISKALKELESNESLEITLNGLFAELPISQRTREQIILLWKSDAPDRIRKNPYELIYMVYGIGFLTADRIAKRVGFDMKGYPRISAGITHLLMEAAWDQGHTFLPKDRLIPKAAQLLGLDIPEILSGLERMREEARIAVDGDRVYFITLYSDEQEVAQRLKKLRGNA